MSSKYDNLFTEEEKEKIRNEYLNGCSIRDIVKKYNIKSKMWIREKLLGNITRNFSESITLSHKKYPKSFKHTKETKLKLKEIRLKYLKEHPEETAWRKRNEPSYPEKCFIKFLQENEYDKKYLIEREKSIFPYYIDFAFINEKIAVEIDGSQHLLDEERKENDKKKDLLLTSLGWKVIRISEDIVKNNHDLINNKLKELLSNNKIKDITHIGIIKVPKGEIKISKNGKQYTNYYKKSEQYDEKHTIKQHEYYLKQRKVKNRPSKKELFDLITNFSFRYIAKLYNVCDKTIVKWCKSYDLPYRKKDLKKRSVVELVDTQV